MRDMENIVDAILRVRFSLLERRHWSQTRRIHRWTQGMGSKKMGHGCRSATAKAEQTPQRPTLLLRGGNETGKAFLIEG